MVTKLDPRTGELVPSTALVLVQSDAPTMLAVAESIASHLRDVIAQRKLAVKIEGHDFVRYEGWATAGTLAGYVLGAPVFAQTAWSRRLPDGDGWEARAEVYCGTHLLTAAEAMCDRGEKGKGDDSENSLRSTAQTRAASKALRTALGWIMTLAGYEATPAEEMQGRERAAGQARGKQEGESAPTGPTRQRRSPGRTATTPEQAAGREPPTMASPAGPASTPTPLQTLLNKLVEQGVSHPGSLLTEYTQDRGLETKGLNLPMMLALLLAHYEKKLGERPSIETLAKEMAAWACEYHGESQRTDPRPAALAE